MSTKEKFYDYVRNATHVVNQGSRKMFLTVPARSFIVLIVEEVCRKMTEK